MEKNLALTQHGQVHPARLFDGREVAVKVREPGVGLEIVGSLTIGLMVPD
jgi:ABC1 atypical kinase-like domain